MNRQRLDKLEKALQQNQRQEKYEQCQGLVWPEATERRLRTVDTAEEMQEIWKRMGIEPGTEAWRWRVETYIH